MSTLTTVFDGTIAPNQDTGVIDLPAVGNYYIHFGVSNAAYEVSMDGETFFTAGSGIFSSPSSTPYGKVVKVLVPIRSVRFNSGSSGFTGKIFVTSY